MPSGILGVLVGIVASLALSWLVALALLLLVRPKGIDLREAKRLVPDLLRLLRSLAADPSLGSRSRRRLALLLAYLAFPIDLVPDVIPLLGYADDVIVIALVLRTIVRAAGAEQLDRHWTGTPAGLALVRSISGVR